MNLLEEMLKGLTLEAIAVEDIRVGPFLTAVSLEGKRPIAQGQAARCGLASTLAQHQPGGEDHAARVRKVGSLEALEAKRLARYLLSEIPLEASIGMATLNAALDIPPQYFNERRIPDLVLEEGRGQRVAVVGHFPFVKQLRKGAKELHVFELNPVQGDLPASRAGDILPTCQTVVLTATVLMNGTYREMLPLCSNAFTVMVGPSTPPSPVLFEYGVDVLAGSLVIDPEETLSAVSQGATYRDLRGVRKWTWIKDIAR